MSVSLARVEPGGFRGLRDGPGCDCISSSGLFGAGSPPAGSADRVLVAHSSVVRLHGAGTDAQVGAGNLFSPPVHLRYAAVGLMACRRLQACLLASVTGSIMSLIGNCAAQVAPQDA